MRDERYERLKEMVWDALQLPPDRREEILAAASGGDHDLLVEARGMVAASAEFEDFLEPVAGTAGTLESLIRAQTGEDDPDFIGTVFTGRYRAESELGRGASGIVYEATDLITGDHVALKVWPSRPAADAWRVRRETAALRILETPGVVRILDEGDVDGVPFIVTAFVDGTPFPGRTAPVAWHDLANTAAALFDTLTHVHNRGILHGDLKPANVLVDANGRPVVLDLGTSRGPAGRRVVDGIEGTPAYWAPEQLDGGAASVRSDLYAVGVMLYEALAGHDPHPAQNFTELIQKRLEREPLPLPDHVPGPVARLVERLLARVPDDRPESAADAAAAIKGELPPLEDVRALGWLGDATVTDRLVAAADAGRSLDVAGPSGSGRTHYLKEASGRLRAQRRDVIWAAGPDAALDIVRAARTPGAILIVDDA
ncbi:MAG: serine/threonine protein kinase, partial [Planctomycetota bacterium]|nr:serine/threonine protein kinase [Planctomycetota bacterium]